MAAATSGLLYTFVASSSVLPFREAAAALILSRSGWSTAGACDRALARPLMTEAGSNASGPLCCCSTFMKPLPTANSALAADRHSMGSPCSFDPAVVDVDVTDGPSSAAALPVSEAVGVGAGVLEVDASCVVEDAAVAVPPVSVLEHPDISKAATHEVVLEPGGD